MSFVADKKREHETAAEKALVEKDYAKAFFHTAKASEFGFALAEQSEGKIAQSYVDDAFELLGIAEELKAKAAKQAPAAARPSVKESAGDEDTAQSQWQLKEKPTEKLDDVAGLDAVKEELREKVVEPFLHPEAYEKFKVKIGGGILMYGPPGNGKTFIAKAIAGELDAAFFNVNASQIKDKYVGETERHIRLVFQRAREKASEGMPVIVFFDEMDSLFRTRGSGVSSDVENTIVPQLLSEIDGVESLENVIVIGASNREDMIDPAILRPGRLDVKIKIERPDAESARDILSKYLTPNLPLHPEDLAEHGGSPEATCAAMIQRAVERMYAESEENRFLEVTYANGDKEILYFKDFNSGAMLENIVARAKKMAIKDFLDTGQKGLRVQHILSACVDEFRENEDLPNTTNPDDWARISGKKGERIVFIRTLVQGKQGTEAGRSIDTVSHTGQYL